MLSPAQLVRIELLRYDNPEGLHPIEAQWRDLCKVLLEEVEQTQKDLEEVIKKLPPYNIPEHLKEYKPLKLPRGFEKL